MLRRLSRLLIVALLFAVVAYVVSRLMGGDDDDDFDDFDDLDSGFEFQETPVEIDVPAGDAATQSAPAQAETTRARVDSHSTARPDTTPDTAESANASVDDGGRLIGINGIGPAYEARLQAIGINSIDDLAHADAESLASQIEVIGGASTIGEWITQARSFHTDGQS